VLQALRPPGLPVGIAPGAIVAPAARQQGFASWPCFKAFLLESLLDFQELASAVSFGRSILCVSLLSLPVNLNGN
jgi:hypothetical protein